MDALGMPAFRAGVSAPAPDSVPVPLFSRTSRMPRAWRAPPSLEGVRDEVMRCRACPLYACGSQPVFGEGPRTARLMLVGEQPGDEEERAGRPIAGAAGQLLDRALAGAGIARGGIYITNAVKHFKFTARGKRRVQQRTELQEITACRSWLDHEIALVKPSLILALGAAAGRALLGRSVPVGGVGTGRLYSLPSCVRVAVTAHPSDLLRGTAEAYGIFVDDLRAAQARIDETEPRLLAHAS